MPACSGEQHPWKNAPTLPRWRHCQTKAKGTWQFNHPVIPSSGFIDYDCAAKLQKKHDKGTHRLQLQIRFDVLIYEFYFGLLLITQILKKTKINNLWNNNFA